MRSSLADLRSVAKIMNIAYRYICFAKCHLNLVFTKEGLSFYTRFASRAIKNPMNCKLSEEKSKDQPFIPLEFEISFL
jgi:hypothetical protein